jgi:hypothetical protein
LKQLANPLSHQRTVAKWLVITQHKDAEQVIGYSQSTGETTSHPTKQPQNGCQVVGYKPASWQVAGYRNDRDALRSQLKPRCNDGNSKYRHCERSEAIQQD